MAKLRLPINALKRLLNMPEKDETALLALGKILSNQQRNIDSDNINDFEFKIFSQFGDDGIIQYLIKKLDIKNETFVEFGVGDYSESNTRFLLMNNNWAGFVMDSSNENMSRLKKKAWYWKHDLRQKTSFITIENINNLLSECAFSDLGLLHIDLDGVDYHIFKEIDLNRLNPSILIFEYNSLFGLKPVTVPYSKDFDRTSMHFSNLYWGASLTAFDYIASERGYSLVGSNLAGNNAYFVRKDLLNDQVRSVSPEMAFKKTKYRESRDKSGNLSYLEWSAREEVIRGMKVLNVINNMLELL